MTVYEPGVELENPAVAVPVAPHPFWLQMRTPGFRLTVRPVLGMTV